MKRKFYKDKKNCNKIIVRVMIVFLVAMTYLTLYNYVFVEAYIKDLFYYSFSYIKVDDSLSISIYNELKEENKELKEMLEIKNSLSEVEFVNATVVERNTTYWFNTITINKGKLSGISKDMAVVTSSGLIGKVEKVTNYTSVVKLITSNDVNNKISVSINTSSRTINKIMSSDDKNNNVILGIEKDSGIAIGDKVLTSGLSDIFPKGIVIGEVIKIDNSTYGDSYNAYVKLSSSIDNIRFVTVLKRN